VSLARQARMLEATKPVVFAGPRRKRDRTWFYTPPEVWDRCPDCCAQNRAHQSHAVFDAARDRALAFRDANEAAEIMALEMALSPEGNPHG
jgi:hypothetical protein